jgi:hypothetical protein
MNNNQLDVLFILSALKYNTLHVSGVSTAHHQEIECTYVAKGSCYTCKLTVDWPGCNGVPFHMCWPTVTLQV